MRALISLTILFGFDVLAAEQSIGFRIETNSQNGRIDITSPSQLYKTSQTTEAISYRLDGIGSFNTQLGARVSQPDYSTITIRNAEGAETPLSELTPKRSEIAADLSVEYLSGPYSASVRTSATLTDTPFPFTTVELRGERGFNALSTLIGTTLTFAKLKQPESFFTSPDFQFSKRPTDVNAYRVAIHHEQVLSENWKMRSEIASGRRIEDRPLHLLLAHRQGYAFTDRLFADLRASYISELRSTPLVEDTGYFRTYGAQAGVHFEPFYDWIVSVSYGLYFEHEEDPRIGRHIQVASDQYGLGIEFLGKSFDVLAQAAYAATNSGTRDLRVSGGLTWRL